MANDLDELEALDMQINREDEDEDEEDYESASKKERLFIESFDRDSDLLDDKDLNELKEAQNILAECGLDSDQKIFNRNSFGKLGNRNAMSDSSNENYNMASPCVDDLNSSAF